MGLTRLELLRARLLEAMTECAACGEDDFHEVDAAGGWTEAELVKWLNSHDAGAVAEIDTMLGGNQP